MSNLKDGIYEEVISKEIRSKINKLNEENVSVDNIDESEATDILLAYLKTVVKKKFNSMEDAELDEKIKIINKIVDTVSKDGDCIDESKEVLKTVFTDEAKIKITNTKAKNIVHPETSIAASSLFTGAIREPQMYEEMKREIRSSDSIDFLVSFIRWSGLRLIIDDLRYFTQQGGKLRVITTTYMGATEAKAIEELAKLPNTEIKISYDVKHTRLHAKSYVFYRNTGYSTAYVGSSNMTNPAMTSGLEWNVKVAKKELASVFQKIEATFQAYWNSDEFIKYDVQDYAKLVDALNSVKENTAENNKIKYFFEVKPYPYQQAILDKLIVEREVRKSYKNLVVAATGCGKTTIAAFDYKRQCINGKRPRLLFVAHRQEILEQSIQCFREVLQDSNFGDLYVGSHKPEQFDYLFASINMINKKQIYDLLEQDFYDFIVLDECHHIAAKSYKLLLEYFEPEILLGLTATPERMDGESILGYFNNRIAAEIRLPEAIDRKLLCPFQYFAVYDETNLENVKWRNGGYDIKSLNNLYVLDYEISKRRANLIVESIDKYIGNIAEMKGLVFCASVEHATFMNDVFNSSGIKSECITGKSSEVDRATVKNKLANGDIKLVCVVDVYNEGVDIKQINTVMFLRPTESLTVYLQQLGRGLRLSEGKECLTVLDFVGNANKKYSYEKKFQVLMESSNRGIKKEIENGFLSLPKGCYISLEQKAKDVILNNIRNFTRTKIGLIEKARCFAEDTGLELTFTNFLEVCNIKPRMLYSKKITFTEIKSIINDDKIYNLNDNLAWKKLNRLSLLQSSSFLEYMLDAFKDLTIIDKNQISDTEEAYWKMMYISLYDSKPEKNIHYFDAVLVYIIDNKLLIEEIVELFKYSYNNLEHIEEDPRLKYNCALRVYSQYTRAQVLAALDYWNTSSEGVTRVKDKQTTCLFITLNKSNSFYSPSIAYHDYSINDTLFHWQSQNATSAETSVGQRYINNREKDETILLFVREQKEDNCGQIPFVFLGPADYVSHTGGKPMNIVWKLKYKIPAHLIKITDKLGIS